MTQAKLLPMCITPPYWHARLRPRKKVSKGECSSDLAIKRKMLRRIASLLLLAPQCSRQARKTRPSKSSVAAAASVRVIAFTLRLTCAAAAHPSCSVRFLVMTAIRSRWESFEFAWQVRSLLGVQMGGDRPQGRRAGGRHRRPGRRDDDSLRLRNRQCPCVMCHE